MPLLLMSNLVCAYEAWRGRRGGVVRNIYDSLQCFKSVVGHVGFCDDLLPSLLLFLRVFISASPVSIVLLSKG